nr:uncharacterized protein LOC109185271 [Ipomoea batatas]
MRSTSSSWQAMNSTRKRRYENPPPGLFTLHLRHGGRLIQTLPAKYIGGEVSTFTNMEEDEWGFVCLKEKVSEIGLGMDEGLRDLDYKGLRGVVGADCNNDGSGEEYDVSEEEIDGSEEEYDGSGEEIGGSGEDDADFVNNTDLNVEYGGLGDVEVQNQDDDNSKTTPEVEDNQWEIPDDILDAHWHQVDLHTGGNAGGVSLTTTNRIDVTPIQSCCHDHATATAQQGMTSKGKAVKAPSKDRRKKLPIRKSCGIFGILLLELKNGSRNCYFVYSVNVANMYLGGEVAVFEVVVPSNQNAYVFGSTLAVFGSFEVNTF